MLEKLYFVDFSCSTKFLNNSNQGDYNSIFKGSGIDFDDLRPYQYGDDHRSINWNITAKEDKIYTNTYKEDKEQSVFFLLDISQSQYIGKNNKINIFDSPFPAKLSMFSGNMIKNIDKKKK